VRARTERPALPRIARHPWLQADRGACRRPRLSVFPYLAIDRGQVTGFTATTIEQEHTLPPTAPFHSFSSSTALSCQWRSNRWDRESSSK
jgi:hypothetical protein